MPRPTPSAILSFVCWLPPLEKALAGKDSITATLEVVWLTKTVLEPFRSVEVTVVDIGISTTGKAVSLVLACKCKKLGHHT
jgi:hypothetical protein